VAGIDRNGALLALEKFEKLKWMGVGKFTYNVNVTL